MPRTDHQLLACATTDRWGCRRFLRLAEPLRRDASLTTGQNLTHILFLGLALYSALAGIDYDVYSSELTWLRMGRIAQSLYNTCRYEEVSYNLRQLGNAQLFAYIPGAHRAAALAAAHLAMLAPRSIDIQPWRRRSALDKCRPSTRLKGHAAQCTAGQYSCLGSYQHAQGRRPVAEITQSGGEANGPDSCRLS